MNAPTWRDFRGLRYSAGGHLLTRELSQRCGAAIAYAALRLGLTPTALTLVGLLLVLSGAAALALAPPTAAGLVLALFLLQAGYAFDCADGQLARGGGMTSVFGAWLDLAADYVRCIALGTAVTVVLVRTATPAIDGAFLPGTLLACGMVISAHTSMRLRATSETLPRAVSPMRSALRLLLDTPTILLVLVVLREYPRLLATYAVVIGCVEIAVAAVLAHRRLRRT